MKKEMVGSEAFGRQVLQEFVEAYKRCCAIYGRAVIDDHIGLLMTCKTNGFKNDYIFCNFLCGNIRNLRMAIAKGIWFVAREVMKERPDCSRVAATKAVAKIICEEAMSLDAPYTEVDQTRHSGLVPKEGIPNFYD